MNNDERAAIYVASVQQVHNDEWPTWEMLETAFVSGMAEQARLDNGEKGLYES